jgi:hypothetical protein
MGEDGRAVAFHVFVEPDAGAGLGHDRCERGLADVKRITPQVVAVQLDEIEGVEEYALVSALVTDEIERGNAVVIAGDSFAVAAVKPKAIRSYSPFGPGGPGGPAGPWGPGGPSAPAGPAGPGGPCGPTTFQVTKRSGVRQAAP